MALQLSSSKKTKMIANFLLPRLRVSIKLHVKFIRERGVLFLGPAKDWLNV
ncbi:hypothetical protein ACHAW5_005728 [Stephanodiscus triporus]|uniref:Uncharacterized protein n=1 Tax=Stephanodiscus triporus TaxID=2934178 RepID=A0ABD3QK26_9STRA